ncbi:MAG TPA: TatD family hydrolase [Vicinamibacterales bacterium]|nr:TatD family hydrolase [Vicinamibacterales bacterium]
MIDSHCHIAGPEFAADLDAVVARATAAGLTHALVILAADDQPEIEQARTVAERWSGVRFSVGVHPHAAGKFAADPGEAARAVAAAIDRQPLTRGLGEIGLDYHYDFSPRETQQTVFRRQIALARERRLPIVIHTREAEDDTFRILEEEKAAEVPVVLHCFTGDRAMARRALEAGYDLSLAGIVTFPRAAELQEVARLVPLNRLLIETDSPFLAPVPYRGKRNEPANVVQVAETIAGLKGTTRDAVATATSANFVRIFAP